MKKRFLSLILCIAMLFSTEVAGFVALAIDSLPDIPVKPDVWVTLDGEIVDDFGIEQNQKVELLANISGIEAPKYQWQILMDAKKGIWVDIYDKTTQKCEVSYALLKGMLDGASVAYLRCAAFGSDGMKYYSDAIAVTVFVANPDLGIETLPPEESLSEEDLIKYYIENGMFSLLADDVSEYRTITIKYLDIKSLESGIESAIYSPYIAKVEKGTPFNQNVISPTFLGFAPYFDTDGNGKIEPDKGDADGSVVIFNETAVNEDIVINLYYKPINVPFGAKYFFQNINDDLYTENVSLYHISNAETGTIIQDELLKSWAGKTEGFEMMYHIPEAVAADGSTVFECYYDRLYYLLHFDNNGGYGVDPIYARYGTPFIVNDPIRYGYEFGGWDKLTADENGDGVPDKGDGIADTLPSTIQAENDAEGKPVDTYYRAIWTAVDTVYTVAYWVDDGLGDVYYLGSKQVASKSGVLVSGSDDLESSHILICGKAEGDHIHTDDCIADDHVHTVDCVDGETVNNPTNEDQAAFNKLATGIQDGYAYAIKTTGNNTWWTRVRLNGAWYSVGGSNNTSYIVDLNNPIDYAQNNNYHAYKFEIKLPNCPAGCGLESHQHSNECYFDGEYLLYNDEHTDKNVEVYGDGSTVVNVYYKHKEYTLRFYYARSSVQKGETIYQVVGGTSYYFGSWASGDSITNATDGEKIVPELLKQPSSWGKIDKEPELESAYINNQKLIDDFDLKKATTDSNFDPTYTYYYIEFTAPYGANIADVWPVDVFGSVAVAERHNSSGHSTNNGYCKYPNAYFSAWNGQYGVEYSHVNSNQTIKGTYQYLDESILFSKTVNNGAFADETTVSYLCFWENGHDTDWSIPKIFEYNIY